MNLKKNWKKCLIGIAVIAIGAVICFRYFHHEKENVTSYTAEFEEEQEKPEDGSQEAGTEAGIEIPGYKSIEIPADTKNVKIDLTNPESNNVYFEISFYLPETDETIYTSKLIKPGQHIYEITLNREMEKGEYPLTLKYATYSADESLTPKNGADINCTLIVK